MDGLDALLRSTPTPPLCSVPDCPDNEHSRHVISYFCTVTQCTRKASKKIKAGEFSVAGWNDTVTDKHEAAHQAFLDWVSAGKLRTGHLGETMKSTGAQFKLALRYCRNNEEMFERNGNTKSYF